jgi:hypothetical protein
MNDQGEDPQGDPGATPQGDPGGTPQGDSGTTPQGDLGAVPQDLVNAGAPAQFADWTDQQKNDFFKQAENDEAAAGDQNNLQVAVIEDPGDGTSVA